MSMFLPLFSISVEHGFFSRKICSCLDFVATEKTRRVIASAGLLLRKTTAGISVAYDEERLEALQQFALDSDDVLYFEFKVYSQSPEFRDYTHPFSGLGQEALFFCNENVSQSDEAKVKLHANKYASTQDLIPLNSIQFKDVLNKKDRFMPPVFTIKIAANNKQGMFSTMQLKPTSRDFYICFESRQTIWKFFLLGDMAKKSTYISDTDDKIEFEYAGETTLEDQRIAMVFKSKQNIPLNEKYNLHFQLKKKSQEGERVLIDRLPVACLNHVGKEVVAEEGMVVSEIYINSSL